MASGFAGRAADGRPERTVGRAVEVVLQVRLESWPRRNAGADNPPRLWLLAVRDGSCARTAEAPALAARCVHTICVGEVPIVISVTTAAILRRI